MRRHRPVGRYGASATFGGGVTRSRSGNVFGVSVSAYDLNAENPPGGGCAWGRGFYGSDVLWCLGV